MLNDLDLHGGGLFILGVGAIPYIMNSMLEAISYGIDMKGCLAGKAWELHLQGSIADEVPNIVMIIYFEELIAYGNDLMLELARHLLI